MNNNISKYCIILAQMIFVVKKEEIPNLVSGFSEFFIGKGLAIKIDSILSLTKKIINKKLMQKRIFIRKSKDDGLNENDLLKIKNYWGNDFFIEEVVDKSLISGMTIETYGNKIDSSIKSRLINLSNQLNNKYE